MKSNRALENPTPLTRNDVKARLGCGDSFFWKLLREGKLKGFYVGRDLRFQPEEIDRYIEEGQRRFEAKYG